MLRVSPKVLMYVDARTRRTMGAMLGSYIEPGTPHPCGPIGSEIPMTTNSQIVETLRLQVKRSANVARLAWQKLTRKKPAEVPPIKSQPDKA